MKSKHFAALASVLILALNSCQKDDDVRVELAKKAEEFTAYVKDKRFVPVDFYADKPVDYVETDDVVLAETDLRKYMYNYIKDDQILFDANGVLKIYQNEFKMPENDSAVLIRGWSISPSTNTVRVSFVDYDYEPRRYHLVEFSDTSFLAYVDYKNDTRLYSRFSKR